jgi:hypothetical protein
VSQDKQATLRPVVDRDLCEERLKIIFPPGAFDTVLSNRLAASSVAAMIYVGAVVLTNRTGSLPGTSSLRKCI